MADKKKLAAAMALLSVDSKVKACIYEEKDAALKVTKCTAAIKALHTPAATNLKNMLPNMLVSRGQGYMGEKKPQVAKAVRDYDAAIKLDPQKGLFHFYRGIAYMHQNKADPALNDFKVFVSHDTSKASSLGYIYIGYIYEYKKAFAKAAAAYRKAISINPELKPRLAKRLENDDAHADQHVNKHAGHG